jgi:hypothetical protein
MFKEWDGREAPKPGQGIEDDRFYYRRDKEFIHGLVHGDPFACRVVLGLRRFGKTSLLKRIERFCNGANGRLDLERAEYKDEGIRAYFIVLSSAGAAANEIERGLQDSDPGIKRKLFLIDDLQNLGLMISASAQTMDQKRDFSKVAKAFTALFKEARARPHEVSVILAEPTNHLQYLAPVEPSGVRGASAESKPGPKIAEWCGDPITNIYGEMHALLPEESKALLTGSSLEDMGHTGRRFDITESAIQELHVAFGGNPWFLAFAHARLAAKGDLGMLSPSRISQFISDVDKEIETGGLRSIYEALSSQERLVVDLLHDYYWCTDNPTRRKKAVDEGRETLALFGDSQEAFWKVDAKPVHLRLHKLGLVDKRGNFATKLTSDVFLKYVDEHQSPKPIIDQVDRIPRKVWGELIKSPGPWERLAVRCVVHQFSDLLFEEGREGHKYWRQYINYLAALKKKKEDHEDLPHIIIVCGNLIPGDFESVREESAEAYYRKRLLDAFECLRQAIDYMKPTDSDRVSERQIIVVPGVLDVMWPETAGKERGEALLRNAAGKHQLWRQVLSRSEIGFSTPKTTAVEVGDRRVEVPVPVQFDIQNLVFIPFDSTGLEGVYEELGSGAVEDVIDIRRRIRLKFANDWNNLRNVADGAKAAKKNLTADRWRNFIQNTWRYIILQDDDEASTSGVADEVVTTSPFRWAESSQSDRPGGSRTKKRAEAERNVWLSDSGFVATDAREHFAEAINTPDTDRKPLRIAVTHHALQQQRRGTLVEFSQAFRLRQALIRNGVNWILHGHSLRQHRVTMAVKGGPSARIDGLHPGATIDMVASGTFSPILQAMPDMATADFDEIPREPSFNVIVITPQDRNDPTQSGPSVEVIFKQLDPVDLDEDA